MENVFVGIRKATFDAQIAFRVGAFTLDGNRMSVVLLHGDTTVEQVERVLRP